MAAKSKAKAKAKAKPKAKAQAKAKPAASAVFLSTEELQSLHGALLQEPPYVIVVDLPTASYDKHHYFLQIPFGLLTSQSPYI